MNSPPSTKRAVIGFQQQRNEMWFYGERHTKANPRAFAGAIRPNTTSHFLDEWSSLDGSRFKSSSDRRKEQQPIVSQENNQGLLKLCELHQRDIETNQKSCRRRYLIRCVCVDLSFMIKLRFLISIVIYHFSLWQLTVMPRISQYLASNGDISELR